MLSSRYCTPMNVRQGPGVRCRRSAIMRSWSIGVRDARMACCMARHSALDRMARSESSIATQPVSLAGAVAPSAVQGTFTGVSAMLALSPACIRVKKRSAACGPYHCSVLNRLPGASPHRAIRTRTNRLSLSVGRRSPSPSTRSFQYTPSAMRFEPDNGPEEHPANSTMPAHNSHVPFMCCAT
ncbi:MAG: hypothetical protein QM724_08865 [Flavobacteriales bacterium]